MIIFAIILIVLIICLVPFLVIRKREHLSGEYGERRTSDLLSDLMLEDEAVINNYMASRNRNNTASIQIDHIFISHKGIFVIETKDYRGRIYGSRNQNSWTQVLAYGKVKNKLYNPIKQNETHCNYINRLLNYQYPIYNVVIFIKADIKRVSDAYDVLFEPYSFASWYKGISTTNWISALTIQDIKQTLLDEMNRNQITKEEHIRNVRRNHE